MPERKLQVLFNKRLFIIAVTLDLALHASVPFTESVTFSKNLLEFGFFGIDCDK